MRQYFTLPVVATHHSILRYSQRVNYLLSTHQIKQNIEQQINKETCQELGKHQQIIDGMRYIISACNEVITVTHLSKTQKREQDGNRNKHITRDRHKRERTIRSREKRYTANDKRAVSDDWLYQRDR